MVFPLTANKKNLPKIPKSSNKKNKKDRDNVDKPASKCEAVYGQQQRTSDILDDTIYRKLSSSRAIFESNKLESACSFLKMLKLKLEQDVGEIVEEADAVVLERTPTNDTISSILDTLIDVSDHITPIVSDVSDASKSMDYSTMSGSSTISEKHFNRTMLATNKLLELSAKTGRNNANLTEGTYYFAHKMVADNLGDMSVFKNSIMSIGDKIYVDRNLLAQLVQLHALLKDTIIKLKTQEEKYLTDLTYRNEEGSSNDGDSASGNATDLSVYDTAIESDPSPAARKLFGKKDKLPKTMIKPRRLSMDNASPVVSKRPSASSQQRNNTTAIVGTPRETANSLTTDKMKKKKLRQSQNAIAEASVLSVDGTVSDNEGPNSTATPSKEDKLCNKNQTPAPFLAPDSTYKDGTTNYTSAAKNSNGTMTQDLFSSAVQGTNTSTENSSKLVGTITSILKQTSFYDPELVTSTPMKDNRTQTKRSMDTWASTKGNTSTVSNQTYMTAYNDTIVSSNLIGSRLPGEISNGNPSVNSVRSRSKSASSYRTALNATSPTTVAEYGQDLEKCITELECMSKCLRQAAINKDTLHECFKIFPANQHQLTDTQLPHFHTIVGGVPVVIQITKRPDNLNSPSAKCCRRSCAGSTTADASTCCSDLPQASTKPLTYKLLGSLSKATLDGCLGPRNWGPCNWKKTILRNNKNTEKGDFDKAVRTSILKSKLPRFRLKKRDAAFNTDGMPSLVSSIDMTKSDGVDSHASLPYVPAKSSLPKLDNPEKICSSLQFDVRKVPVTFEDSIMKHPNAKVNDALKDVTVAQLLDSFRPAKCCRKTVLNETPHSTMPYAASLRSLPLQESDLTTIRDIMQSNNVREFFKQQTLFEYYVHFQRNIITPDSNNRITNGGTIVPVASRSASHAQRWHRMYQVFFFELFNNKKSDDEEAKPNATNRNQSHQSSNINNSHPDLRILDFIKKIYNSDPIYEKKVANKTRSRSREDGDKTNNHGKRFRSKTGPEEKNNDGDEPRCSNSVPAEQGARHRQHRHHHHHHHHHHRHQETNKCKKTETKSYYTSVESYSTTNANYYVNSSTSSTVSSKYTRSKNSDSTMYSFLLIPRNELNACASNNELSTSYAPSVNSLPFEDEPRDDRARPNVETNVELNPKEHCDDTDDCDLLSPRNYAKTLNAIYELDENGKMRTKSQDGNSSGGKLSEPVKVANSPSSSESRFDLPCNTRNLSTIYEIDEKLKESDLSVNQKLSSKLFNQNRHHQDMNRQSSVAVHVTSSERSRIPVSIHSLSSCTSGSKEKLAAKTSRQLKVANASSKSSLGTTRSQYSVNNPLCDKRASSLVSHNSSKTSAYSQCSRISKLHSSSIDSVEAYTLTKNLVAKVHPKVAVKQSNVSATSNKSIKLQPALDGTDNLELPITFDIVRPSKKNSSCTMKIETNVMSLNIDSTTCSAASGIRDNRKRFRCYRSENMCVWPQLQKKFETSNKAFYISVHTSQHNMPTITNRKPSDDTSRIKVLQRYPNKSSTTRHCTIQQQDMNEKVRHLSLENFVIGNIQSDADDSKATHNPRDRFKARKHKQVPAHPEVIDIKVSSDVKSTKLNHRFLREGYGPGYVTVLSPPCNCPDITIFLPCCCDQSESCSLLKNTLSREAQQYSLIPVVGKETK